MVAIALVALVASWALTAGVRQYAERARVLDVPSERSSHTTPTPRGGGLAIAVVVLTSIALGWHADWLTGREAAAFALSAAVAAVGWADDHRPLPPGVRVAVHFGAAGGALLLLGGFPTLDVGPRPLALGILGQLLALFGIVWAINFFNFMDGIDGLAGAEATLVGAIGAAMLSAAGAPGLARIAVVIAGASAGFLLWNWPPARIFMGDVGSGMLGFLFGTLAVAGEKAGAVPVLVWVILLGAFIFDATVTLARRVSRGERWHAAHRSHAYQRALAAGRGHRPITLAVIGLDVALAALAVWGDLRREALPLAFVAATALVAATYLLVERRWPMRRRGGVRR
jgi:Fuc2NAc and GlcNAc transferase